MPPVCVLGVFYLYLAPGFTRGFLFFFKISVSREIRRSALLTALSRFNPQQMMPLFNRVTGCRLPPPPPHKLLPPPLEVRLPPRWPSHP